MEVVVIVIVVLLVVSGIIFFVGRALGDPVRPRKFDETAADVAPLDTSDGTPVDLTGWDANIPTKMSPEEQEQAAKELERLRSHLQSEGHR